MGIDNIREELMKTRIRFIQSISKINDENEQPYFDNKWLYENMLGIKEIYCPDCLKEIFQYDDNTLAPVCSCGWTGNMTDLLTEKEMNKEVRRRKISNINKI